jgi:UDP-N-acetyl-D-glucosamine dehydrogenase
LLEEQLSSLKGRIKATNNVEELKQADVVLVCVPTPAVKNKPDLSFIESACRELSTVLHKNQLVVIESTVYPGTVETIVKPLLEKSGLKAGKDFFLGHCPERIDPGNKRFTLEKIPRVLACLSKEGTARAKRFYDSIIGAEITLLSSVKAVEAVKVVENTFRDINIAFVNELAKSFDKMGIDLVEVIKGASTKPFGYMPFYPGPGVGGHCIPQDPYYLIERARQSGFKHRFLSLAREINEGMPRYVVSLVEDALEKLGLPVDGAKIAVLGVSYKPDIDDTRKSPALQITSLLKKRGAKPKIFDPLVPRESTVNSIGDALDNCPVVVLATHHRVFVDALSPNFIAAKGVKAIVDARNCLDKNAIEAEGIIYKGVGR